MNGPIDNGPEEPGPPADRDGIRNAPRIPAPRPAVDDLDQLPRHPHPPPSSHGPRPRPEPFRSDVAIHSPEQPEQHGPPEYVDRPEAREFPKVTDSPDAPESPESAEPAECAESAEPKHRPAQPDRPGAPEHTDRTTVPPEADMSQESGSGAGTPSHSVLKSLLGAWALAACSTEETAAVEVHLGECAPCADEALRLRDAVGLLHPGRDLDLDPLLRFRVLENCLGRRPARIPVPEWASPYDSETARLDALLRDFGESEWKAPVELKWFNGTRLAHRTTTVGGVIGHLMTVDGLVAGALGLDDPLGRGAPHSPTRRTEQFWQDGAHQAMDEVHSPWRDQSHALVRTVSFAGRGVAELSVSYGEFSLPLRDSLLDRAFECWLHADDIADAVDYPYDPPRGSHLNRMIDLAARLLPATLAARRRQGLASPPKELVTAGAPGRSLRLEVEGAGGGNWYIALDSPAALGSPDHTVAQVALEGVEFCKLVAGHVSPRDAAAGQDGDREAINEVLLAAASLGRL